MSAGYNHFGKSDAFFQLWAAGEAHVRGRESVIGTPPPSEPDVRISRIRLSS